VNQWQIICCIKNGQTAPLVAPFKPKDADLFSIISNFEATYADYNQNQNGMERYWTLKYIQQQKIDELIATVLKESTVRADDLPLVLQVTFANNLTKGTKVRIKLGAIDEITLDVTATVIEKLTEGAPSESNMSEDEAGQEDEMAASGTVSIAITIEPEDELAASNAV
jgi:exoribonuclease-2